MDGSRLRSRREFLAASLAGIAGSWPGFASLAAQDSRPQDRLIAIVPFSAASDAPPLHRLLGSGLDARLFTDLSTVERGHPITPNDRFFYTREIQIDEV